MQFPPLLYLSIGVEDEPSDSLSIKTGKLIFSLGCRSGALIFSGWSVEGEGGSDRERSKESGNIFWRVAPFLLKLILVDAFFGRSGPRNHEGWKSRQKLLKRVYALTVASGCKWQAKTWQRSLLKYKCRQLRWQVDSEIGTRNTLGLGVTLLIAFFRRLLFIYWQVYRDKGTGSDCFQEAWIELDIVAKAALLMLQCAFFVSALIQSKVVLISNQIIWLAHWKRT